MTAWSQKSVLYRAIHLFFSHLYIVIPHSEWSEKFSKTSPATQFTIENHCDADFWDFLLRAQSTAKTRPGSATKRPGTAKKFSTSDLIKSASGLFSVFDRNKAQEEVRKLEADVKGVEKVQAKLAKAEHKAAVATEIAERAHR